MDYTLVYSITLNPNIKALYLPTGDVGLGRPVIVPVVSILPTTIEKGSRVRVVVIDSTKPGDDGDAFYEKIAQETRTMLDLLDCEYEVVRHIVPNNPEKKVLLDLFCRLNETILSNSTILTDVTFGPKYIPLLQFCMLNYAERFLDCEIGKIIYGQVDFDENRQARSPVVRDIAPLYLLSSFSKVFGHGKEDFDRFVTGFLSL